MPLPTLWHKPKTPVLVIPPGDSYDLADILKAKGRVDVRSLEDTNIVFETTDQTKFHSTYISGLTVTVSCYGNAVVDSQNGSCERYASVEQEINPKRDSQYFHFTFENDPNSPFSRRVLIGSVRY